MDKKLLDKLNGFNLSMQQKEQLIKLIQEVGGGTGDGGSSRNDFVITIEQVEEDGEMSMYYNFNGKYRAKGETKTTIFDIKFITNTEIYKYCLDNMTSNVIFVLGNIKLIGHITICGGDIPSLCLAVMQTDLTGGAGTAWAAETQIYSLVIIEPSNEN